MNIALWVTQGILSFLFIMAGGMKLFSYQKYRAMLEKSGPTSLTHGVITLIGVAELAGAAGMVLPMALNVAPWLTVWAAAGLAVIMLSATVFHIRRHEAPIMTSVLFVLAVVVVVGRSGHWA
jgi:putative oxidoreductase